MKYDKVLLVLFETTRNTGNLEEYFAKNTTHFYLYLFPATYSHKGARLIYYENRKKQVEKSFFWYKGDNKIIKSIFHYLYYSYISLFILPRNTKIITYQVLYCLLSSLFHLIKGHVFIFCVGDYFPDRRNITTHLYHLLVSYYNRHLHYVLYPSDMLRKVYKDGGKSPEQHRDLIYYGVKNSAFKKEPQKNLIGFIGNLRPKQGVELIFDALRNNKKLRLEIIGSGIMLEELLKQAEVKKIKERVKFLGFLPTEQDIVNVVRRWQMGLAPYDPDRKNMTYYAEPSKIKFYLQHKLPVVMTKITYISKEIEKYKAGICINYDEKKLVRAIKQIQNNSDIYLKGVKRLVEKYEFNRYYDKQFKFLESL